MKEKIYISGKVTGVHRPEYHRQFSVKEEILKIRGYIVLNPVRLNEPLAMQGASYEDLMKICFAFIDVADAIYMLDGWEDSPGARRQHERAVNAGKKVIYESVERRQYEKRIETSNREPSV